MKLQNSDSDRSEYIDEVRADKHPDLLSLSEPEQRTSVKRGRVSLSTNAGEGVTAIVTAKSYPRVASCLFHGLFFLGKFSLIHLLREVLGQTLCSHIEQERYCKTYVLEVMLQSKSKY